MTTWDRLLEEKWKTWKVPSVSNSQFLISNLSVFNAFTMGIDGTEIPNVGKVDHFLTHLLSGEHLCGGELSDDLSIDRLEAYVGDCMERFWPDGYEYLAKACLR